MKNLTVNSQNEPYVSGEKLISYLYSGGVSGTAVVFSVIFEILFIFLAIFTDDKTVWVILSILGLGCVIASIVNRVKIYNQYGNTGFEIYSDRIVFVKKPTNDLMIEQKSILASILIILSPSIGYFLVYFFLWVNLVLAVLIGLLLFGISAGYSLYWMYILVKNTRAIQHNPSSCIGEMLLLLFVPFYSCYWYFTRGELIRNELSKRGYSPVSQGGLYLVLSILGLNIVATAMMQRDFNQIPTDIFKKEEPEKPEDSFTFDRVKNMYIKGCVLYVETNSEIKKIIVNSRDFRWNLESVLAKCGFSIC